MANDETVQQTSDQSAREKRSHRVLCLISVLAMIAVSLGLAAAANAQRRRRSATAPKPVSRFTGTYRGRFGDWEILDQGGGQLKVECSLVYPYKVRGLQTANLGEGNGQATLIGNVATFKPEGTTACTITLKFVGNKIIASQDGSDADCGFGHNVYANGTYIKRSNRPPKFDAEK